jgi:hypothetical protein
MIAGYLIYSDGELVGTCKDAHTARELKSKGHQIVTIYY